MKDVIVNDIPSKVSINNTIVECVKGTCTIKFKYKSKIEAEYHKDNFRDFDIVIHKLTEKEYNDLQNDRKTKTDNSFYDKYLFDKGDIFAIGDVHNVNDDFIKSIVPCVRYTTHNSSMAELNSKIARKDFHYEFKNFNNPTNPFGILNTKIACTPIYTTPKDSWNSLIRVANISQYAVIYFKYKD